MPYTKTPSTNFYELANFQYLLHRLEKIQPDAERKWGSMSVTQMLHHLNVAIGGGLGYFSLPDSSNVISRNIAPYFILNILRKFPPGIGTAAPLKVEKDTFVFEEEKKLLMEILTKAYHTQTDNDWSKHTYFGALNRQSWGKLIMIHCNHHFQQFNA